MAKANDAVVVEFVDVTKEFRARGNSANSEVVTACKDLSFSIKQGEVLILVGETGCGKSTTLSMLLGLLEPTRGSIRALDHDPYRDFHELAGEVGIIFQTDRLLPWRKAIDNAAFGLEVLGVPKTERHATALSWLTRLGLGHVADAYPHELSGGMRQRVSIARAFAIDPNLVIADEAFSALDEVTGAKVRRDLCDLIADAKKTAVFVTHSIAEAVDIGHRVLVMAAPGQIVKDFDVQELRRHASEEEIIRMVRDSLHAARATDGDREKDDAA